MTTAIRLLTRLFLRFWRWLTAPVPIPYAKRCDCCNRAPATEVISPKYMVCAKCYTETMAW